MPVMLSIGYAQVLTQNVVASLPARRCLLSCDSATPALEQSNDVAFGTLKAITLDANNQAEVAHGFIRSTFAGGATVYLKALA
jgi:hypothetical protein